MVTFVDLLTNNMQSGSYGLFKNYTSVTLRAFYNKNHFAITA